MKAIVIMVVVILIIGAAGIYYINQRDAITNTIPTASEQIFKNETADNQDKVSINDSVTIDSGLTIGSNSDKSSAGSYQEYSKESFDANAGKKTRILFFYADWCPTCRPVDTEIKANLGKIPEDIEIIRVNYNDPDTDADEKNLAAKYGITYQHTFVRIDSAGNEIDKWNGGDFDKLVLYMRSINALDEPGHGLKQPF